MTNLKPWRATGATVSLACTATSAEITTLESASQVRIYNRGPNTAFLRFGSTPLTAVATDIPFPAGTIEIMTKDQLSRVAGICAATETATVYFTPVEGF